MDETTAPTTEKAIKPCPPKKDKKPTPAAAASSAEAEAKAEDEDAPGIGTRMDSELEKKANNAFAANDKNGNEDEAASSSSFSGEALVVPGLLFAVVGFVAYRFFSGDHKKDA